MNTTVSVQPPDELVAVLADFDRRRDGFRVLDVHLAIGRAVRQDQVPHMRRAGWWAESAAFALRAQGAAPHDTSSDNWFRPLWTLPPLEGRGPTRWPDLGEASEPVVIHWGARARAVTHPVLVARYADLVWDSSKIVTGKRPSIDFARLAIDAYLAQTQMEGADRGESQDSLWRALMLAQSVKDTRRIGAAVEATIAYVDKTAVPDLVGTYLYLFDMLIASRGVPLTSDQERGVVRRLEEWFAHLTAQREGFHDGAFRARILAQRLAAYYRRREEGHEIQRVLREAGRCFERQALSLRAVAAISSLDDARRLYVDAGLREESARVQRAMQELAPKVKAELAKHAIEVTVPVGDARAQLRSSLEGLELDAALEKLVRGRVHAASWFTEELASRNKAFPLQAMFGVMMIGDEGVRADVPDCSGDPDGPLVFEIARWFPLFGHWLTWGMDYLVERGLTAKTALEFVIRSPLFDPERLPLVQRGIEAHFDRDHVASIHLLLPQIEHALRVLLHLRGGTLTKAHQSGRGVIQFKNFNDLLKDEEVRSGLGQDLRLHLEALLSHPKGVNIRNEVCHGLWAPAAFSREWSQWVLHGLLALALIRDALPATAAPVSVRTETTEKT